MDAPPNNDLRFRSSAMFLNYQFANINRCTVHISSTARPHLTPPWIFEPSSMRTDLLLGSTGKVGCFSCFFVGWLVCLFLGYAGLTDHHHVVHIPESLENVMRVLTMGDRAWWGGCSLGGWDFRPSIFSILNLYRWIWASRTSNWNGGDVMQRFQYQVGEELGRLLTISVSILSLIMY